MKRIFEAELDNSVTVMIDLDAVSRLAIVDGRLWFDVNGHECESRFPPHVIKEFIEAWKKWKGPTSEQ